MLIKYWFFLRAVGGAFEWAPGLWTHKAIRSLLRFNDSWILIYNDKLQVFAYRWNWMVPSIPLLCGCVCSCVRENTLCTCICMKAKGIPSMFPQWNWKLVWKFVTRFDFPFNSMWQICERPTEHTISRRSSRTTTTKNAIEENSNHTVPSLNANGSVPMKNPMECETLAPFKALRDLCIFSFSFLCPSRLHHGHKKANIKRIYTPIF